MNGIERIFERFTRASLLAGSFMTNKLRNYDCKRNLSPIILKGNQMVYSLNKEIISRAFCRDSHNFPRLKAREIIRILTKRANFTRHHLITY